jgi:hypothetical protein
MRNSVLALMIGLLSSASGYVSAYHVEPVKAAWSGTTRYLEPYNFVSQGVTINFDELDSAAGAYVELFAGAKGGGGDYHLSVLTNPGGSQIAYTATANGNVDHEWVRFHLQVTRPESIVKGKKLTLKFTRSSGDSIQFYYDSTDQYKYGCLWAGGLAYATGDLACRVYGRMNEVDSLSFGADEIEWWNIDTSYHFNPWTLAAWTESAHVKTVRLDVDWHQIQYVGPDSWDFGLLDSSLRSLDSAAGCRIVGLLTQVPKWASSRVASVSSNGDRVWSVRCPPRHLERPVDSASNYLAAFLRGVIAHCDSRGLEIHDWEVLNEVNSEDMDCPRFAGHFFRRHLLALRTQLG